MAQVAASRSRVIRTMLKWRLQVTVVLAGLATMTTEMLAARFVAPDYGTSLLVWTNVLGVVMGCIALGSYLGGRLADRGLGFRFLIWTVIASGFLLLALPTAGRWLSDGSAFFSAGAFFGSLVGLVLLFGLPILLLSMMVPFAVKLRSGTLASVGGTAGGLYASSTAGAIVGTFLPAHLLLPTVGTNGSIVLLSVLLLSWGGVLLYHSSAPRFRGRAWVFVPAGCALLWTIGTCLGSFAGGVMERVRTLEATESAYHYISVREILPEVGIAETPRRVLILNEGLSDHSVYEPSSPNFPLVGGYWDYASLGGTLLTGRKEGSLDVCVVGLAAGTVPKQICALFGERFDIHIDGVEVDSVIIDVARRHFDMNEKELVVHVCDGRTFLRTTDRRYDVIVNDAFRQPYIPFHLATKEFFELEHERLKPGGVVVMNVGAASDEGDIFRAIAGTVACVFETCRYVRVGTSCNFLVIARRGPLEESLLSPASNEVAATLLATPAGLAVEECLAALRVSWKPFSREPGFVTLTDDHAPVEYLTEREILKHLGW